MVWISLDIEGDMKVPSSLKCTWEQEKVQKIWVV